MKLTFLGTNGWYSDKNGNTVCTLLETKNYYIVFDAGDGINKLANYIKSEKPIFLFLSHLHLDHIIGFHAFAKLRIAEIKNEIKIFCPKGTKKYFELIVAHPFTNSIDDLKLNASVVELDEGKHELPVSVECMSMLHIDGAFGYSVYEEDKKITYLCDTGVCENSKKLAKDSDIVIHECSMKEGISNDSWGHTSSVGAAMVAKESDAKKLILTHFSPLDFPKIKDRQEALSRAKEIFENTILAEDDMSLEL